MDRASIAAPLEMRSLLVDDRFCGFSTCIPTACKWQHGNGKRIRLEALGFACSPEQLLSPRKRVLTGSVRELTGVATCGERARSVGTRARPGLLAGMEAAP